jgi:hypothetical protein
VKLPASVVSSSGDVLRQLLSTPAIARLTGRRLAVKQRVSSYETERNTKVYGIAANFAPREGGGPDTLDPVRPGMGGLEFEPNVGVGNAQVSIRGLVHAGRCEGRPE